MFFFRHLSVLAVNRWSVECYRLTDSQRKCQRLSVIMAEADWN